MRKLISLVLLAAAAAVWFLPEAGAQGGPVIRMHVTDCNGTPYVGAEVHAEAWSGGEDPEAECNPTTNGYGNCFISFVGYTLQVGDTVTFVIDHEELSVPATGAFLYVGQGITEFIPADDIGPCDGPAGQPGEEACCVGPWAADELYWHIRRD